MPIRLHEEDAALLRRSIELTANETGFAPRLIEKDYFCTVLLEYLASVDGNLVFKGGTCLTKVHGDFYRLSEDLDFSISTPAGSPRSGRSRGMAVLKTAIRAIEERLPAFSVIEPLRGANKSTQYNAALGYTSMLDAHEEPVRIEIGLREPILTQTQVGEVRTALLNPITGRALVDACKITSLSYEEAMAEKLRAALCRREIAIRDYFDVDYAIHRSGFDPRDRGFLGLLRRKLEIPGNDPMNVSEDRVGPLRRQVDAQLRPVLRARDFAPFDLERAIDAVRAVARALERAG